MENVIHSSKFRLYYRLFFMAIILFLGMNITRILLWLKADKIREFVLWLMFFLLCKVIGLRVNIEGVVPKKRPLFLVTNHCSYLDIFVLESILPISFTPKSELKDWPVIGTLCRLGDSVFIERSRHKIAESKAMIAEKLDLGRVVCVFPEGTTNDGLQLKPFKSGLFSIAENDVLVQPATISYMKINGVDISGKTQADLIAWYDDMELEPHAKILLGVKNIDVKITFHQPVESRDYPSRKELCAYCEEQINTQFNEDRKNVS